MKNWIKSMNVLEGIKFYNLIQISVLRLHRFTLEVSYHSKTAMDAKKFNCLLVSH